MTKKKKEITGTQSENILETSVNDKHKKKRKHQNVEISTDMEISYVKRKKIKEKIVDENDKKTILEKNSNTKHKKKRKYEQINENKIPVYSEVETDLGEKRKIKQKLNTCNEKEEENLSDNNKHNKKRKQEKSEEYTEEVEKKKQKIKRKRNLSDDIEKKTQEKSEKSRTDKNKENANKKKKKKNRKKDKGEGGSGVEKKEEIKAESSAKDSSLEYLKLWSEKRHLWKFQKVRQTWLLKHCFHKNKISDEYFDILLRYLEGLKGNSRETTIKEAEEVMQKYEDISDDDDTKDSNNIKCDRARQLIQLLS